MKKVSPGQVGSFCGLLCNASNVVSKEVDGDELQYILEKQRTEFTEELGKAMPAIFVAVRTRREKVEPPPEKFEFVKQFDIVVPEGYNHDTHLDSFRQKNRDKFYGYNDDITDAHFSPKATTRLRPGQKLTVKIFRQRVKGSTTPMERMDFLRSQKAIFTGAHGSTLVFEQRREELPKGKWYASFDEKEAL